MHDMLHVRKLCMNLLQASRGAGKTSRTVTVRWENGNNMQYSNLLTDKKKHGMKSENFSSLSDSNVT